MQTMTEEEIKKVNVFFNDVKETFLNLHLRWTFEGEYENIKDYEKPIKSHLPKEFMFVKMTKRPFGFQFKFKEYSIKVVAQNNIYKWKRIA